MAEAPHPPAGANAEAAASAALENDHRRDALRIIGAIGVTCAFPFPADELYGQHAQHAAAPPPPKPVTFSESELGLIGQIAELIIPATTTPGAIGAGVPAYIDAVCSRNAELTRTIREGLGALRGQPDEAMLAKLEASGSRLFRVMKNLTADGYYTSRIGLMEELGYSGNHALGAFPSCSIPEQ
jgi:hypothetical protein